mgnify:CR=1 FL=1
MLKQGDRNGEWVVGFGYMTVQEVEEVERMIEAWGDGDDRW